MNVHRFTPEELASRLNWLRSVPRSALPELESPVLNDLRADVLALDVQTEPLRWLRENRPTAVSRAAFRSAVASIDDQTRSASVRLDLAQSEPGEDDADFDWRLRIYQSTSPPIEIARGVHPLHAIVALVLKTPADIEPLEWIATHGLDDAAMVVLGAIISLSRRPPDWSEIPELIDRVALVSGESIATVNGARLNLRIERLYVTKNGFQLPVSVSYDDNRPAGDRVVRLDFREIDIVQDDLGNHYQPSTRSGAASLTRGVARWELSYYPALAPEARQLTVGFSDAIVTIESLADLVARMETRPSRPFDGPTVAFGELLVTIPLSEPDS